MGEEEKSEYSIPDMSQLEFEDVVSILMGVPPEGEEIIVYEDEEES
jgi:hypothetical protein